MAVYPQGYTALLFVSLILLVWSVTQVFTGAQRRHSSESSGTPQSA